VRLQRGDFLVIYTDGVTEAANARDELFEESRLQQIIEGFAGQSVDELAAAILDSLKSFTEGSAQSDDITVLVVQYKGDAAQPQDPVDE
jgi:sigma-B regulation protein RsbU (phosphoserine phosphatase)